MDNKRISEIVEEEMIKQDANRYRDMRKILTIPKSIADMLYEELNPLEGESVIETFVLGVNLVKVVEGIDDNY